MSQRILSISLLCPFCLSGCFLKSGSTVHTATEAITLNTAPDQELFQSNTNIPATLQQEIKRQFLSAVGMSTILREYAGANGNLLLKEIGIAKTQNVKLDIDVSVDGKVQVSPTTRAADEPVPAGGQMSPPNNGPVASCGSSTSGYGYGGTTGGPSQGMSFSTRYHVVTNSYNVSFAFVDKAAGADGEMLRFSLNGPLESEENFCVSSRARLTFSGIKALPPTVASIVARFIDDISLAIDAGMAYERSSEVSTRMFYKAKEGQPTPLMRDFLSDVIRPVCIRFAERNNKPASSCDVQLPPVGDAVATLEGRFAPGIRPVARCEKTGMRENLLPIYKLYFEMPAGAQVYQQGSKSYLYERVTGGWQRFTWRHPAQCALSLALCALQGPEWSTVEGAGEGSKCGNMAPGSQCIVAKYGANFFDSSCKNIESGKFKIAMYYEEKNNVFDAEVPKVLTGVKKQAATPATSQPAANNSNGTSLPNVTSPAATGGYNP